MALSMPGMDVTELVRDASGEDSARIKCRHGSELERALLEQGIR